MVKNLLFSIACIFLLLPVQHDVPSVEVSSPLDGQTLQGSVPITGTVSSIGFASGAVYYTYNQTEDSSWFLISNISQPVNNGTLAIWDTSTISDGDYQIKVEVKYQDGSVLTKIIKGLLVRNYTQAAAAQSTAVDISTPVNSTTPQVEGTQPAKIPSVYSTNEIAVANAKINNSLLTGALVGGGCLLLLGIYAFITYIKYHR